MLRLSKTTDYGIVLMAQLASSPDRTPQNARELAAAADLPAPMVSKILKALAREGLLVSQRGAKGGYQLARLPETLSVSEMIRVLEGPVALTDCAIGPTLCSHETLCAMREPWQVINRVVERALAGVTLADLVRQRPLRSGGPSTSILQIEREPELHRETRGERSAGRSGGSGERRGEPRDENERSVAHVD